MWIDSVCKKDGRYRDNPWLQYEGRLLNRTEETVHQEAELEEQWDDGLLISC